MPARHIAEAIDIAAPADAVWALIADLRGWPTWTPTVERLELLDPGPLHVGQRARIRQPGVRPAVWRVTEVDPGRGFVWEMRAAGMRIAAGHRVTPSEAGSRLEIWIDVAGPAALLLGWLVTRKARENLPLEASAARRRSESDAAARG